LRTASFLFVLPTDRVGGAERVLKNCVIDISSRKNTKVTVLFLSGSESGAWSDLSDNQNVSLVFFFSKHFITSIPALIFNVRDRFPTRYDFCLTSHTHANALVSVLRRFRIWRIDRHIARESTVIFDRFSGFSLILFKLMYRSYYDLYYLVCQTQYMQSKLLEHAPHLSKFRVITLRNPVNIALIKKAKPILASSNKIKLLLVGRFVEVKNFDLGIDAVNTLLGQGLEIELHILGDGINYNKQIAKVKALGIGQNVIFHGNVSNPYDYMKSIDIGMVTSLKEGFPNVILEMMACKVSAIVATPCAGDLDKLPRVFVSDDFSLENFCCCLHRVISFGKYTGTSQFDYANNNNIGSYVDFLFTQEGNFHLKN